VGAVHSIISRHSGNIRLSQLYSNKRTSIDATDMSA
jgi:hypothetical protein